MKYRNGIWMITIFALLGAALSASATPPPLRVFELYRHVVAKIQPDGTLVIETGSGATPLLVGAAPAPPRNQRDRRESVPQTFVVVEGANGGHRGFSSSRDDDNDGLVNEDQLDGRDNDHDGRTDEDYAAISDVMVVIDYERGAHLEYYHWSNPHLRGTTFLNLTGTSYRVTLGQQTWREITTSGARHLLSGKTEATSVVAFVAQPERADQPRHQPRACDPGVYLWVGVAILKPTTTVRAVIDGNQLELRLNDEPLPVAICVAESWGQLNHKLNEAARVYAGVKDPVTERHASWIVTPLCAKCRLLPLPTFRWATAAAGGLRVTAYLAEGASGALDPDLFRLAGYSLGAPDEVIWEPDLGPAVVAEWSCSRASVLARGNDLPVTPYADMAGLLDHGESGRLSFIYHQGDWDIPESLPEITGVYLDGRPFTADLRPEPQAVSDLALGKPEPQPEPLQINNQQPRLSPHLLEGYPNPFPEVITLRFRVPTTVGEAFVWPETAGPAPVTDLSAAVPWTSGTPQVSVKIYSLNGQELVTLFSGSHGPGENTVQWTGRDSFGRQVASGTYFCKLQMDKWSTTHRIVFLR